jgi:uncharacterized protein YjbI with pentapeptide repeats
MARRRDPRTPRIDPLLLRNLIEGDPFALVPDGRLEGERHIGTDLTGTDLTGIVLDGCELVDAVLTDVVLERARLVETIVEHATAPSLRAARSTLREVRIENCRFGAAEFFDADWDRVEILGSRIDYLGLPSARLQDVRFKDCTIGELDLRGATVARVALEACRLGTVSVAEARLDALDLRGAEPDRIDGILGLRGAIFSDAQLPRLAPLLAEALGITID